MQQLIHTCPVKPNPDFNRTIKFSAVPSLIKIDDVPEPATNADKIRVLKPIFLEAVKSITVLKDSRSAKDSAELLFDNIATRMITTVTPFDASYYFDLLKEYSFFLRSSNYTADAVIIIAALSYRYSKVSTTAGSTTGSAELVGRALKKDIYCFDSDVNRVKDLIYSLQSFDHKSFHNEILLRDLLLSHLGKPFDTFYKHQLALDKNKGCLSPEEFFKSKRLIFEKLKDMVAIYQNQTFHSLYERETRLNIEKYLPILDQRIEELKDIKSNIDLDITQSD